MEKSAGYLRENAMLAKLMELFSDGSFAREFFMAETHEGAPCLVEKIGTKENIIYLTKAECESYVTGYCDGMERFFNIIEE